MSKFDLNSFIGTPDVMKMLCRILTSISWCRIKIIVSSSMRAKGLMIW